MECNSSGAAAVNLPLTFVNGRTVSGASFPRIATSLRRNSFRYYFRVHVTVVGYETKLHCINQFQQNSPVSNFVEIHSVRLDLLNSD
jgi:hypothetical protein